MNPFVVTPEALALIAGAILSLAFSYIPGLNVAFAQLAAEVKRLIMAGLLLVVTAAIYGLNCGGILNAGITCDQIGIVQLVVVFLSAMITNQTAYQITPLPKTVRDAAAVAKRLNDV